MTLVIDPKVALLKGVDPVQFCVFFFVCGRRMAGMVVMVYGIRLAVKRTVVRFS